ncbi:glycosyltransferase [Spirochaeta africana]|uniref:Glycosyltransferase n=1 Tax=Spirochaeta africana (strain ATCC 700263 / DSM 8902 / Z-7692) TaxID=889378 RepID=H9UGI2_SPIAZ|nr:glycosyltransferase [Spirochaeta africana]AFG36625.1 glycosyltransferase [Spirochaeta africana DSM 8902]
MSARTSLSRNTHLIEAAWEVCNQVGGIYTVIRTKIPGILQHWNHQHYVLTGPYFPAQADAVVDPQDEDGSVFGQAAQLLRARGYRVVYGRWLVPGRPQVVLIDPESGPLSDEDIRRKLQDELGIPCPANDPLFRQVARFNLGLFEFCLRCSELLPVQSPLIAHFHEWMAGLPIALLQALPETLRPGHLRTVFTTHATLLGRYLAMQDLDFYENLAGFEWQREARHYGIEPGVRTERAAANGADVFTTVSAITADECTHLLGRTPDLLLPNGINSERFEALHEFQNLHKQNKERIHAFTMGHFFRSTPLDLDTTLYFFTSGRYEFRNKGFDMTLDALSRVNTALREAGSPTSIVMFFITRAPYHSINPNVLESRALLEELRNTCDEVAEEIKQSLLYRALREPSRRLPDLNSCISEHIRLRLRRSLQSWESQELPYVTTHTMVDSDGDPILQAIRRVKLFNHREDPVKIVYHPDFVTQLSPLFGMEYPEFVRGCHLGIFPSYYEPWGYTPLECVSSGVPAITSNLSGFGDYVQKSMRNHRRQGLYVVDRRSRSYQDCVEELAGYMLDIAAMSRRDRIELRNRTEAGSPLFGWDRLIKHYQKAYTLSQR